ncbi:MAG: tripartite tricarboxylate transporter substrate binding protein [Betaproteobacteria bacterium]|nr:tripartite tricarboxylate transporter substrate binding protein [Betaproteobacteria bacterium]
MQRRGARAKPGTLSHGTPGVGTTLHVRWETMSAMAGLSLLHVPYKGGALAVLDVISGQINMLMTTSATIGAHARSGKIRVIATTGPHRVDAYADVPTVLESGLPGYTLTNSYAFFGPAGTPRPVINKINTTLSAGMNTPEIRRILAADGSEVAPPASVEIFRAQFEELYRSMEKTVRIANIRP